jgi:hypothetical protein
VLSGEYYTTTWSTPVQLYLRTGYLYRLINPLRLGLINPVLFSWFPRISVYVIPWATAKRRWQRLSLYCYFVCGHMSYASKNMPGYHQLQYFCRANECVRKFGFDDVKWLPKMMMLRNIAENVLDGHLVNTFPAVAFRWTTRFVFHGVQLYSDYYSSIE